MRRRRFDPFEDWFEEISDEIRRMHRMMDRLMSGFEAFLPERTFRGEKDTLSPLVDVIESEKDVKVIADIPGVEKDDIEINIVDDGIEISAEKKEDVEEKKEGYIRRERGYQRFYRYVKLPESLDFEKAEASFRNGVLEITIPKKIEERPKKKIEIKG